MTSAVVRNPELVVKGWYLVCASHLLKAGCIRSFDLFFNLCDQRIAVFRGEDGCVRSLDAYCPHMGADLGIGDVVGNQARCFFHHWRFDGEGQCQKIPCQEHIPLSAKLQSYATVEKYGFIWVYPESQRYDSAIAPSVLPELEALGETEIAAIKMAKSTRKFPFVRKILGL